MFWFAPWNDSKPRPNLAALQHEPCWWVPHSAAERKHTKPSWCDLRWKPPVCLPEAARSFWPFFFYCSHETTLPVSNQWAFLTWSCWQEFYPRTKAKMNFFCRRKVSPDTTLALASRSGKNKGAALEVVANQKRLCRSLVCKLSDHSGIRSILRAQ